MILDPALGKNHVIYDLFRLVTFLCLVDFL